MHLNAYKVSLHGTKERRNHMALNRRSLVAKRIAVSMYLFWTFISIT